MAKKAKAKKGCGCTTKGGKLYIVKTPGKLRATKCKGKAESLVAACRKSKKGKKNRGACSWTTVVGVKSYGKSRKRK